MFAVAVCREVVEHTLLIHIVVVNEFVGRDRRFCVAYVVGYGIVVRIGEGEGV